MAGLDAAIPLMKALPCHIIGIAGSSPAVDGGGEGNSSEHALEGKRLMRKPRLCRGFLHSGPGRCVHRLISEMSRPVVVGGVL